MMPSAIPADIYSASVMLRGIASAIGNSASNVYRELGRYDRYPPSAVEHSYKAHVVMLTGTASTIGNLGTVYEPLHRCYHLPGQEA